MKNIKANKRYRSSLEIMYDRAEANSNKLEESLALFEQWKNRGDFLLYSMLPRQVAEHLRQGKDPIDTCQVGKILGILNPFFIYFFSSLFFSRLLSKF